MNDYSELEALKRIAHNTEGLGCLLIMLVGLLGFVSVLLYAIAKQMGALSGHG